MKTLSEIGGLLVLLKVTILVTVVHKFLFERRLQKQYEDEGSIKELFSYDKFHQTIVKADNVEKQCVEYDRVL